MSPLWFVIEGINAYPPDNVLANCWGMQNISSVYGPTTQTQELMAIVQLRYKSSTSWTGPLTVHLLQMPSSGPSHPLCLPNLLQELSGTLPLPVPDSCYISVAMRTAVPPVHHGRYPCGTGKPVILQYLCDLDGCPVLTSS